MAVSAKGPIRDPERGFVFRLRETARGWEGERNYLVNTDIEDLALTAPEIPRLGAAWAQEPPAAANCIVLSREPIRMGGVDPNGQGGNGGWTRVQVIYGPPAAGGAFTAGLDGKSWTELRFGSETATVKYPHFRSRHASLDAESGLAVPPPFDQIAGGDGAAVEMGTVEALVHVYVTPRDVGQLLARLVRLARPSRVNREPITLPRLQGTTSQWVLAAEQARMRAPEVRLPVNGRVEVIVNLAIAEDWRTFWQPEDSQGRGVPNVFFKDNVYYSGDFSNIW